jgi:superfamily II DNA or RNA helicase
VTKFKLRPYQEAAIEAVRQARGRNVKRMVVCLPTGAGKTVIFSHLAAAERGKVMVLAHREELLEQARDKLQRSMGEGVLVEIEQGQRRASAQAQVVVSSIRSLRSQRLARLRQQHDFRLVIYDECHHATAEDNMRVLRELGAFEIGWRGTLLGFTATTMRADGVGLEKVFEEIVYERSIQDMVGDGYLVPLRGYRVSTGEDLTRLGVGSGQDFNVEELAEAVDIQERNALVARAIQELARDRRTLVFCVTVNHARHLAASLRALGIPTGVVHGNLKGEDRARILGDFAKGKYQAVTNVGVLTEGFDDPGVSCVAMARPTRSQALYVQCVGRGTRLAPEKQDCLVLDFVDLSDLSLVTLPSLFGMPRELNMEGREVNEAQQFFQRLTMDYPQFEMEAGEITIAEIQRRAVSFDPVSLHLDPEIKAISALAWTSLGPTGVVLHFHRNKKKLSELLIMDSRQSGKARYQVFLDQEPMASFSKLLEAVEACDYEVHQMGPVSVASASPGAAWRARPVPEGLARKLQQLSPPRVARSTGDAMRYLAYGTYARRKRWGRSKRRKKR